MPPLLSSSDSEDDVAHPSTSFQVNEIYAKRLEHNKAREELHRLQAKYGDVTINPDATNGDEDDEESSTSESEDEVGELVTPQVDAQIWRTLAMLREGAPEVYDENWESFKDDEEKPVAREKKEKVLPHTLL
jgi:protein KRI1